MKIGIIGAGNSGATVARLFIKAGHEVALSNSRGPESLRELIRELGPTAQALSKDQAARSSDIVLLAVPWARRAGPPELAAVFAGAHKRWVRSNMLGRHAAGLPGRVPVL